NQILIQPPGVDDPARVKDIMQSTAMLEIRQVLDGPFPDEQTALQKATPSSTALRYIEVSRAGEPGQEQWFLVPRAAVVGGNDIRDARPSRDEANRPAVSFNLTNDGGRRFAAFTSSHVGERLAVVLDNRIREVANIKEQIRDNGQISGGGFTEQSAKDLAMML